MSTLVLQIPERTRLRARGPGASDAAGARSGTEYDHVLSPDGLAVQVAGRCAAALLPKATEVVAMLGDADVSWHRITCPKAPAARLRAALGGVLEEAMLDDLDAVHLALAPQAVAGQPTWVAAVDRRWLVGELAALEKADVFVDRIVPASWPDDPPVGHFSETRADADGPAQGIVLSWAHADGVACVRLHGTLARAIVPRPSPPGTRWSATPGAAAAAEQWLGAPVAVLPPSDRALQSARSLWNLRQFDLARRTRGARALRDSMRRFTSLEWRPVRFGLAALLLAWIGGLNLWAWHQRGTVEARQAAIRDLVVATYPQANPLDVQRDALAVVQREAQALRAKAGRAGDTDFETMLQAAAAAWPADRPPVENLRFEPGRLTLAAAGWAPEQIDQFRNLLAPAGWRVEAIEGRLTMSRAAGGAL